MHKTTNWMATIAVGSVVAAFALLSVPAKADSAAAEATYKAKCGACHGADGKGDTPTGKAMKVKDFTSEDVQKMSDTELSDAITNGKAKMPGYGKSLKPEQIKDLVAYIRAFKK